jgi:hypothetical protein
MTDHTDPDLALSRFWNDLAERGRADAPDLDPETVAIIRRLHASANAPLPGSARERVWRGLLDTYERTVSDKEPPMFASTDVIRPGPNGRIGTARPISVEDRLRPANRQIALAIAAVLVIVLVGGIAGGLIQDRLDSNDPRPVPAILAPASPSPEVVRDETLVEVPVPADLIPPGEAVHAGMALITVPVGTFQQPGDEAGGTGTMQEVEAGTEVVLEPRDTLVTRKSPGEAWTNDGPAEAQLVSLEAYGGPPAASSFPLGWIAVAFEYRGVDAWPVDQPTLFRLRQVIALPETVLPQPAEALAQYTVHESDESGSSIGRHSDGSIRFVGGGDKPMAVFIMTVEVFDEVATPVP